MEQEPCQTLTGSRQGQALPVKGDEQTITGEGLNNSRNKSRKKWVGLPSGCLVILLIGLILVGSLTFFGWRRLPELAGRYPAVSSVVHFLDFGGLTSNIFRYFRGEPTKQAGADDKTLLPSTLALYPAPVAETFSIADRRGYAYQLTPLSPGELALYIENAMEESGWQLMVKYDMEEIMGIIQEYDWQPVAGFEIDESIMTQSMHQTTTLSWHKDDLHVKYTIRPHRQGSELMINFNTIGLQDLEADQAY